MHTGGDRFRSIVERRSEVLRALTDGSVTKSQLVDALEISRSTVDRAVRNLESIECITRDDGGFEATATGRLALTEYDRYCERTRTIQTAQAFLDILPADAPVDTAILHGASISFPTQYAPEEALQPSIELLRESTSIRGTAPVILSFYPDLFEERMREDGLSVEIIATEDVLATLPTMMSDRVDAFIHHEKISLYKAGNSLPYALWLMETTDGTHAGITTYDAGGVAGLLVNDSPAAVEWAEAQYEQYLEHAELVPAASI